jgi:hypothetical protein
MWYVTVQTIQHISQTLPLKAGLHITFCLQSCMIRYVWQIRLMQNVVTLLMLLLSLSKSTMDEALMTKIISLCVLRLRKKKYAHHSRWSWEWLLKRGLKTKLQLVRLLRGPQTSFSSCKTSNLPSTRNVLYDPSGMIMQDWRQNVTCRPAFSWGLHLWSSSWPCKKVYFHLCMSENEQQSMIHGFIRISDLWMYGINYITMVILDPCLHLKICLFGWGNADWSMTLYCVVHAAHAGSSA